MFQNTPLSLKAALLSCVLSGTANADLVHPGGWHTQNDLNVIRSKVAARAEPWITGWNAAEDDGPDQRHSSNPPRLVTNNGEMHRAGMAAWVLTMKWVASGDQGYADAAIGIIDTWVDTVRDFDVYGPTLTVSTGAGALAQAAEILEHGFNGEAGWNQRDADAAKDWFRDVIYDPWTNTGLQSSSNWGTSALGGNMSMAIFMDDEREYNYQLEAFKHGYPNTNDGCNSVTDYIMFPTGQALETGRDQAHVQGGIAHLTEAALIMWNQGDELVYRENNRLLAGVEYHARYNLGYNDLPFDRNIPDSCNNDSRRSNDPEISSDERGEFSPVYWMSAKLFSQAGLSHPNTREVLTARGYSPEVNNFAHPGLGMFTFVSTDEVIDDRNDDDRNDDNDRNDDDRNDDDSGNTADGDSINRSNWTVVASNNSGNADRAIDGNSSSRWDTSQRQSNGQWFEIDMRTTQRFNKVVLDAAGSSDDYPRGYKLEVSNDGNNWNTVATGTGRSAETTISFGAQNARYLRIEQTGSTDRSWWSIHEVEVFAAENDEGAPPLIPGDSVDRSNWTVVASNNSNNADQAIDGNSRTRWDTAQRQTAGQWFEIDMRSTQSIDRIVLDTEGSSSDYPRDFEVLVSVNGNNWTTIAQGSGNSGTTTISFREENARYIRIEQNGSDSRNYWSIHEVEVFRSASARSAAVLANSKSTDSISGGGQFSPVTIILSLLALVSVRLRRRKI